MGLGLGIGLGLLALGPGLRRGFLLSYDMVIVPRQPFTATMFGLAGGPPRAVPSDAVLAAASRIVPADIVQKLVLLSIFALACAGAAALLEREPWFARLAGATPAVLGSAPTPAGIAPPICLTGVTVGTWQPAPSGPVFPAAPVPG